MSTEITAVEYEILKLKGLLCDILIEQKSLQNRINILNENEKNIIQKITDLTEYSKKTLEPKSEDESSILLNDESIDPETGQILKNKKKK